MVFHETGVVDQSFFNNVRNQRVTLHASLYLTVFGNPRSGTIPLQSTPVNAIGGLQCSLGIFNNFVCAAPFRWPLTRDVSWPGVSTFSAR